MCGRFSSLLTPELLAVIYDVHAPLDAIEPRYNIPPSQPVMIVRQQLDGERELAHVNWGLIPSWSKDQSIGHSLINARSETVADKPSFRSAYKHRRCIIPTNGYYRMAEERRDRQTTMVYLFCRRQPVIVCRALGTLAVTRWL